MGGVLASLHVVIRVGGAVVRDETLVPSKSSPLSFPRPWEARISAGADETAPVTVEIEGFDAVKSVSPLLRRSASTHFVPGREKLLRVRLEPRCIVFPTAPRVPGSPPGPLNGPVCAADETCVRGSCRADAIPAEQLEAYDARWASHAVDMCRVSEGGAPTLQIGTGEKRFEPLRVDETLAAEPGPQGGHHLWIAVRTQNLLQSGSTTTISARRPDTGATVPPSSFNFPFDPEDSGYCQLYGLRFQLDNKGVDYTQFLGHALDLTVTVVDAAGARASSVSRIEVAPSLANPIGKR
jgi:hypothetical protein